MKRKNAVRVGIHLDVPGDDGVFQGVGVLARFANVFGQLGLPVQCKDVRLAEAGYKSFMLNLPCEATPFVLFSAVQMLEVGDHADFLVFDDDKLLDICGQVFLTGRLAGRVRVVLQV